MTTWKLASLVLFVALTTGLAALSQDTDSAVAVYGFTLDETVALRLSVSGTGRGFDVRDGADLYLDLGEVRGTTGAITDYDLYVSATASASSDGAVRAMGTGGLELRLDEAGFSGTPPTWTNPECLYFEKAVAPPERTLLFTGGNNVIDNTRFAVQTQVALGSLLGNGLRAGDVVTYEVVFTIVER